MNSALDARIAAVVLAAGRSRRMGQPKMLLPWGDTTVIGQVVRTLAHAGVQEILVVTGGAHQQVEMALKGLPARPVFNPRYADGQMTLSLQMGLSCLSDEIEAALVVLGDQPQTQLEVVQQVLDGYRETRAPLVFPSYHMRRGHPWIIARSLWGIFKQITYSEIAPSETVSQKSLRDLLRPYTGTIYYVEVPNDSILRDLDTPADYLREKPAGQGSPDREKT